MLEIPFAGGLLDRAAEVRAEPERLARALAGEVVMVAACSAGVLLNPDRSGLARTVLSAAPAEPLMLGLEAGRPLLARWVEGAPPNAVPLREAGVALESSEAGLAAYLVSLLAWHAASRFCANCGGPTAVAQAGLARRCERCERSHFPRTDPVAIMAVEHADRLLLGRRPTWPANRFSVLAGFVGPGETVEEAVVREVREEAGIEVLDCRYVASQPWPFPSSLMLAFLARAGAGEPAIGDGELAEVRWYERAEVQAAAGGRGGIELPGPVSIARRLIDLWLAGDRSPK